jgi:putative nucleotidyltransferase with HDIG domain
METIDAPVTPPDAIIEMLLTALQLRSLESFNHSVRVADLSVKIGQQMELSDTELLVLRRGALLHDIGRLGIPDQVLNKVEELTADEWAIIRKHPDYGVLLLRKIPILQDTIQIVAFHHERWDGTGYPRKLQGDVIPFLARICAIAEVYDSFVNDQAYRRAWPKFKAMTAIETDSGKSYDPTIVKVFVRIMESA